MTATASDRTPQRQFRGTWAHVDLFDFIESGELSPRAAWLAMIIDSFCKGKKGCFAGNDHLATRLNVKERQIQNLLAELEKVGILKIKFVGKLRHLRIDWSQDSQETRKNAYKADGRHAKNCVSDTQKIASIGEVPNGTSEKIRKGRPATPGRLPPESIPSSADESTPIKAKRGLPEGAPVPANRMKGMFKDSPIPDYHKSNGSPDFCYAWAERLKSIIERTCRLRVKCTPAGWAAIMKAAWETCLKDVDRINAALDLLAKHNGEDGWPTITHPSQFVGKIKWIEDAKRKLDKLEGNGRYADENEKWVV